MVANQPWYSPYYGPRYLRLTRAAIPEEQTRREVEFIAGRLALPAGARVLDLGCGHGRILVELAARGLELTGVDLDEASLALAREALAQRGLQAELVRDDLRNVPRARPYDAVLIWLHTFGYYEPDSEDERLIEHVAGALLPGGALLNDLRNREWALFYGPRKDWMQLPDGAPVLMRRRFDLRASRMITTETLVEPDGREQQAEISARLYTLTEYERMVERAGLTVSDVWGDTDGGPYGMQSPHMIVLARRAAP